MATDERRTLPELVRIIEEEASKRNSRMMWRGITVWLILLVITAAISATYFRPGVFGILVQLPVWAGILVALFAWTTRRQRAAAAELAEIGGLEELRTLLDISTYPNVRLQNAARSALMRLLPQVTDPTLLSADERRSLGNVVNSYSGAVRHPDFVIAILRIATDVYDSGQRPAVLRLTQSKDVNVAQAATVCLRAIDKREADRQNAQSLLRPVETGPAGTLLRPFSDSATPSGHDLLVRPADHDQAV